MGDQHAVGRIDQLFLVANGESGLPLVHTEGDVGLTFCFTTKEKGEAFLKEMVAPPGTGLAEFHGEGVDRIIISTQRFMKELFQNGLLILDACFTPEGGCQGTIIGPPVGEG